VADQPLRNSPLDLGGEVRVQRRVFGESQAGDSFTLIPPGQPIRLALAEAQQRTRANMGHTANHTLGTAAPARCTAEDVHRGRPERRNRPDARPERRPRHRGVRNETARRVTADERGEPRKRWSWLSANLIDRRGAALAAPILLAVVLNIAAVAGLADIAGFRAVYTSLTRIQWPWLGAVVAALAISAIGYYLAYRRIYAAEGGYELHRRQLRAVVAAGFGGLFSTREMKSDGLVLQASGASRREALVRVTTLTGMEQATLALYGSAAAIAWLSLGLTGLPLDVTLPWAVIPLPAFAAAFWLAPRYQPRLSGRSGWRAQLSVFLEAVLIIRMLFARPVRDRSAIAGMALFWAGDALAVWSGLAAFGFQMNGAALILGYCTGMVWTRRIAPLGGSGTLALILPLTIWASGAPLATAITGVTAYRMLYSWLTLPSALASLPVLRETTSGAIASTATRAGAYATGSPATRPYRASPPTG
jgi:hypothetical protein